MKLFAAWSLLISCAVVTPARAQLDLLLKFVGELVGFEPIDLDYHENIGIPKAARIRAAEESQDFDGSSVISMANLEKFPYEGKLLITLQDGQTSVCSSSLISKTRLVTAAHCWFDGSQLARQMEVVLGSLTFFIGGTRVTTNRVVTHPNYNSKTMNNDVAVIVIENVSLNNKIRLILLASGNDRFAGQNAVAPDSGSTGDAFLITNAVCALTYGPSVVTTSTLCVIGAGNTDSSTCGLLSGGPIATNNVLIGVTSFGAYDGCARQVPVGFTRVSSFNTWIRQHM